jgi:outer membrane protein OmpA-like peptidoglycan-associated protein
MNIRRCCFVVSFLFVMMFPALGQDISGTVRLKNTAASSYSMMERSDWSRYDNGKYVGHVYREVRASIKPLSADDSWTKYQGNFLLLEETLRDMRQSARGVDDVIPVSFRLSPNGNMEIDKDRGFPVMRGFPAYPAEAVGQGSKWTAPGSRMADPLYEGNPVNIPFLAEYEYRGIEEYQGISVHRLFAKYALRYRETGPGFSQVQGNHNVDILVRVEDGLPLMMRDILDETYTWPDGRTVRFRGFTLNFNDMVIPLDREVVTVKIDSTDNIDVVPDPEGLKLTIRDIHFVPDSAEFLPDEKERLDAIAGTLKQAPKKIFLVEGHAAHVGNPVRELELSSQRAKCMVDELVKRGIAADCFLYKGWGGTQPVADNSNEEGRRRNRRVEITILD